MKPVLLDTGVIVALLDRNERKHKACVSIVKGLTQPLVTCEAVIAESCYLMRKVPGAADAILENVEKQVFQISFSALASAGRLRRVLRKYEDHGIDMADACLICLAEELDTGEILTLDSDFQVFRWKRSRAFELLIPL